MKNITILTFLLLIINFLNCDTTEPPIPPVEKPKTIKLNLIDVSCTEAFISITASDTVLPVNITLRKNNIDFFNFFLTRTDTIIIDTTLEAGKLYIYETAAEINREIEKSDTLQVKTLELTSHNFTWQKFYFGNYATSYFNDVTIISEDNIWCVGTFSILDSSEFGYTTYNAVHWDGSEWELKQIYYYGDCSAVKYPTLRAIYVFPDNEIVVTNGGSIGWLNGDSVKLDCGINPLLTGAINKIWGRSSNDFYAVGDNGNIVHYQNGNWSKIESGTDLTVHDIWGIDENDKIKILAIASEIFEMKGKKVLSINSSGVTELPGDGLSWSMVTIWFYNKFREYAGGGGIFSKLNNQNIWKEKRFSQYYTYSIRGNGLNDIVICGGFGFVSHFNGEEWMDYIGNGLEEIAGNYYSIVIKENKTAVVGIENEKAVVLIGTRR